MIGTIVQYNRFALCTFGPVQTLIFLGWIILYLFDFKTWFISNNQCYIDPLAQSIYFFQEFKDSKIWKNKKLQNYLKSKKKKFEKLEINQKVLKNKLF